MDPLSFLYGRVALARRRASARRAGRRRLGRPVVSVGNLAVGGTGKTPLIEHLARTLIARGHRPAILSRGYGREDAAEGAVVVSDGRRLTADLPRAGDEPLMLARNVRDAVVVVSPDRYLAGALAERHFGCTVHLLDDGFQHLALHRDVDLLVVGEEELQHPVPLPAGRLREPLAAARHADAVLWTGDERQPHDAARALGVGRAFRMRRRAGPLQTAPFPDSGVGGGARVVAVAAVARPRLFVEGLRDEGFDVAGVLTWPDHHRFTGPDLERIRSTVAASGSVAAVTTEKDMVRLLPWRPLPFALAWRHLGVEVDPAGAFEEWLLERLVAHGGTGGGAVA